MKEVALARIYDGVHYRTSTEVGTDMGRKIGELAAAKFQMTGKLARILLNDVVRPLMLVSPSAFTGRPPALARFTLPAKTVRHEGAP